MKLRLSCDARLGGSTAVDPAPIAAMVAEANAGHHLTDRPTVIAFLKHLLTYGLGRFVAAAVNFVGIAAFTRLLSPAEFGVLSSVLYMGGLIYIGALQWLRIVVDREVPIAANGGSVVVERIFALLAAILTVFALFLGLATLFRPDLVAEAVMLFVFTASYAIFELSLAVARGRLAAARFAALTTLKALVSLGCGIGFIMLGAGWSGPLIGLAVGHLIAGPPALSLSGVRHRPRIPSRADVLRWLALGFPTSMALAIAWLIYGQSRLLLLQIAGEAEAGRFAAAFDLSFQSIIMMLAVVHSAAFPLAARLDTDGDREGMRQHLQQWGAAMFALAGTASVTVAVLSQPVSDVILGGAFRADAPPILALAAAAAALCGVANFYTDCLFQLQRRTGLLAVIAIAALIANLALNAWLIPLGGATGAALASVGAYLLYAILSVSVGLAMVPERPRALSLLRSAGPVLGAGAAALLVMQAPLNAVMLLCFGGGAAALGAVLGALAFNTAEIRTALTMRRT